MQLIRSAEDAAIVADPAMGQLLCSRIEAIASDEPYDANLHGYYIVLEAGDTLEGISAQVGFDVMVNRWTGIRYDQPGYTPDFELLEEYATCWSLLFIIDDSGYGIELFIPKADGVDPDLTAMCRRFAAQGTGI